MSGKTDQEKKDKEILDAVGALRDEFNKASPDLAKIKVIEKSIEAQEEENQKITKELIEANKNSDEQKEMLKKNVERMDELEVELARRGGPGDTKNYKDSEEYKAVQQMCIVGKSDLDKEQKAILRTDNDSQGGVLVPTELDNIIVKSITEISAVRTVARVRTIASKSLEVPKRTGNIVAAYEGEAESGNESNETYGSETLTAYRQSVTIPITQDMLMDAAFDMESEIMSDAGEAFAQGEGAGFVAGSGFKQPAGIISNVALQAGARTSSTSLTIDAADVILLTGDLKTGYNPVYLLNRLTLAVLRTKVSTTGQFLWQPGLNGPIANTINGFPYLITPDMQDLAAGSYSVAFGDFRRGYTIVDRTGMSIVRDDLTRKKEAIIEFTINRWNTGQVTLTEAIKLLKTKA